LDLYRQLNWEIVITSRVSYSQLPWAKKKDMAWKRGQCGLKKTLTSAGISVVNPHCKEFLELAIEIIVEQRDQMSFSEVGW